MRRRRANGRHIGGSFTAASEPLARAVENEVAEKLALDLRLNFGGLFAADLAGRGRALKQMVDSGVALDLALAIVGLGGEA